MIPKISVIIPTYNGEKFIGRAIESVLNQTFKNFELIVIDDGSTDNTKGIVMEYQKKDERIKYLWEENFGGPARPYNLALKQCQGEYIAFLDHDDEWFPEKLEKQLAIFKKYEGKINLGLVTCGAYVVDPLGNNKGKFNFEYNNLLSSEEYELFFEKMILTSLSCVVIKKEVFEKLGNFDEKFKVAADLDMYLRMLKRYNFYYLEEPLANYTQSDTSLSHKQFWIKQMPEYKYLLEKYKEDFKKYPKVKSKICRNIGTFSTLNNNGKMARKYFKEAIKKNPINLRLYFQYFLSFFPKIYKKMLFIKRNSNL
jgi:glycosyltransferase involved in cell wall biosynthesis